MGGSSYAVVKRVFEFRILYTNLIYESKRARATYGFVGDSINMEEYGSIGFGPVSSSSSCFFSSSDDCLPPFPSLLKFKDSYRSWQRFVRTACSRFRRNQEETYKFWLGLGGQISTLGAPPSFGFCRDWISFSSSCACFCLSSTSSSSSAALSSCAFARLSTAIAKNTFSRV